MSLAKQNPIEFGEYIIERLKSEKITQTNLAKDLNKNRSSLHRYIKMAKWSQNIKDFVNENRNITNTMLIEATKLKEEKDIIDFFKDKIEKKAATVTYLPNVTQPKKETENELCNTPEKVLHSPIIKDSEHVTTEVLEPATPEAPAAEVTIEKFPNTKNVTFPKFSAASIHLNFCAVTLWLIIVPITATFFESILGSFSYTFLSLKVLSFVLAAVYDSLIFRFLASRRFVVVTMMVVLNVAGAFYVATKGWESGKREEFRVTQDKLDKEIEALSEKTESAKARYLVTKWPKAQNPETCETGTDFKACGAPFIANSKPALEDYISKKSALERKLKLKAPSQNFEAETPQHFMWHVGFYLAIWVLIFLIEDEKHKNRKKLDNAVFP